MEKNLSSELSTEGTLTSASAVPHCGGQLHQNLSQWAAAVQIASSDRGADAPKPSLMGCGGSFFLSFSPVLSH